MSTDAMRAALNAILNKEAVYGEVPGLQRPTEFALASYYWRVIGDMKRVARAALAQPVSAEPVAPIANVKVFGCYDAAQVPLDVRGVYQLDGFTTGVYVDMPSGACAPISPPPTSAEPVAFGNAANIAAASQQNSEIPLLAWGCGGATEDGTRYDVPLYTATPASVERVPLTDEAPVAADARGMLEFISARFKHAGVSQAVAESYARDIDAILAADAKPARGVPLTDAQIVALAKQSDGYELRGDHPRMIGFCPGPLVRFARAIERAHGIGEPK